MRRAEARGGVEWGAVHDAVAALVESGYATAKATRRRKLVDIMRTFRLDLATADRCLRVASGLPLTGGQHWRRRIGWIPTAYPQVYAYRAAVEPCKKETPRPLQTVRGADSR